GRGGGGAPGSAAPRSPAVVAPGGGGGLVAPRLGVVADRGGPAGPAALPGGVLLAAEHVVPLDARVLGGADRLDQADRLTHHAGRVGEVVVGGHDQHAVLDGELPPQLGDLLGPPQALERVHDDQVDGDQPGLDLSQHLLQAGALADVPPADGVVAVAADALPGEAAARPGLLDGGELLVGRPLVLAAGAHAAVVGRPVRLGRVVA